MLKRKEICAAVAACLFAGVLPVSAQERKVEALAGESFLLEEVIITARKREENMQVVPISVEALSEEFLREKDITKIEDAAKYSPSLNFQVGVLPNDTRPVIRGLNITRGRPNVGILVDGIDVSSETLTVAGGGAYANANLMDLERIEIIKGPQSAVYGRSAFAGVVNYITRRPYADQGVYGEVSVDVNEHEYYRTTARVGGPLIAKELAGSLIVTTSDFDGYYDNPNTGGDLGGTEDTGAAVALNWTPNDTFEAYFRGEHSEENYTPRAVVMQRSLLQQSAPTDTRLLGSVSPYAENMVIPGGARGLPQATPEQCASATPFNYLLGGKDACATMLKGDVGEASESDIDQSPNPLTGEDFDGTEIKNTRFSLDLDWQLSDNMTLTSLTGYSDNETSIEEDFDLTNFELESNGPGSARIPPYLFADIGGTPPDLTLLGNNPNAAYTQFGVNTNTDTSFDYDQFSQELRLSGDTDRIEWMVDALYWTEQMEAVMNQMWWLRESADADFYNSLLSRQVDPTCTLPGQVESCSRFHGVQTEMTPLEIPLQRDTDHWSIAASVTYSVTEAVRVTAEGRYLEETLDYTGLPLATFENGFLDMDYYDPTTGSTVPEYQHKKVEAEKFVPRLSVDWQINDQIFTYASAAAGFKPGGIATTDADGDILNGEYEPEELWAYEVGVKSDLLENRLRLNGAVFYYDYTDQQIPYFVTNEFGVTNVSITNAGESEVKGFEVEAQYRPSQNWTFTSAYTYSEAILEKFSIIDVGGTPSVYDKVLSGNVDGDYSGKAFPNTPEDTVVLSMRYDGDIGESDLRYFAELYGKYVSKRYLDQGNLSWLDDVWIAEFTAGLLTDTWQVVLYVENLTDEDKVTDGLGNVSYGLFGGGGQIPPFGANLTLPQPRTVGIRASYEF